MPNTNAITDFDEPYTLSEADGITTIRAAHPDDETAVTITQFDADADWFDTERFSTVLDQWGDLDGEPHIPHIIDNGGVSSPWVATDAPTTTTARGRSFFEDIVVSIIGAAADAISTAHNAGLYHGHLDPSALVFDDFDEPMSFAITGWETALTDLPQPRETTRWDVHPEPPYLAPEQSRGETTAVSTSDAVVSDIYQLGMTAYAMLCYDEPTSTPDRDHILDAIPESFPDRDAFATAIETAVAPDPNDRYQSMAEFASALNDIRVRV